MVRARGYERVVLVAAGERWRSDGSLRPAYEDLLGCGAIAAQLAANLSPKVNLSPEAQASIDVFNGVCDDLLGALARCQSGIELDEAGYGDDVVWASALNAEASVPLLHESETDYPPLAVGDDVGLRARKIVFYQAHPRF